MSGDPLDAREVTFEDVTFKLNKMLPMEAKKLFINHVRPLLSGALDARTETEADQWQILLAMFTNAPAEHYHAIVQELYKHITFSREGEPFKPLAGDEDFAFVNLDMAHLMILEVRAFYINFRESFFVAISEFPLLTQVFGSQGQSISIRSSATPSTLDSAD